MYCNRKNNRHAPIIEELPGNRLDTLKGWLVVFLIGLALTALIIIQYP